MSIENLKRDIPDYAKDIRLNLSSITRSTVLNERQLWGCLLAAALTCRNDKVTEAVEAESSSRLAPAEADAVRAAAAIMAMNNVYYRSVHLLSSTEYGKMPARLRMNVIGNPGVEKVDFELWSLVVSAINGCGMCLDAHEREVTRGGLAREAVQEALRIAAVIHAVSAVVPA